MTTVTTDPARWLNGESPRSTARTNRDATSILTSVPKEQRSALTTQQKLKLQAKCEEGLLEPHFDFLTHGSTTNLQSLKMLYSVRMKVEELRQSLTTGDMHGVFLVPDSMCVDPTATFNRMPAAGSAPLDLFNSVQEVSLELAKDWSEFLIQAGEKYLVENLFWSAAKIKASLSDSLREKLIEKTMGWPITHQTGVVYFKLIMIFIEESTPKSTRSLITQLQTLGVRDYDGENVIQACSTIKGAYEVLMNKRAVPIDFLDLVFDVLKRCSIDKFVNHIRGIRVNHDQKVKEIDLNYLLTEAEVKYNNLDDWPGTSTNQDSVFNIETVECWNCGQLGHYSNDCPKPQVDNRGRGRGRRGRGRGRGGRGGRSRQGRNGARSQTYERSSDPRFKPPSKNDPRVRTLNEVVEYWCGTCRCWTNHPTDKHSAVAMLADASQISEISKGDSTTTIKDADSLKTGSTDLTISSKKASFAAMLTHFS